MVIQLHLEARWSYSYAYKTNFGIISNLFTDHGLQKPWSMSARRVQQKELVSQKGLCYNRVVYYRRMRNGGYAAYKRLYLEAEKAALP